MPSWSTRGLKVTSPHAAIRPICTRDTLPDKRTHLPAIRAPEAVSYRCATASGPRARKEPAATERTAPDIQAQLVGTVSEADLARFTNLTSLRA